jgi:hypothetical protein
MSVQGQKQKYFAQQKDVCFNPSNRTIVGLKFSSDVERALFTRLTLRWCMVGIYEIEQHHSGFLELEAIPICSLHSLNSSANYVFGIVCGW